MSGHALSNCIMTFSFSGWLSCSAWKSFWSAWCNAQHWSFPLTANWIRILQHPNESSHGLTGWGHCFRLLFLWQFCNAIPCSVLFLYERDETSHSQTHGMLFHWCLCSSVSKHNIAQISQFLKLSTTDWTPEECNLLLLKLQNRLLGRNPQTGLDNDLCTTKTFN